MNTQIIKSHEQTNLNLFLFNDFPYAASAGNQSVRHRMQ